MNVQILCYLVLALYATSNAGETTAKVLRNEAFDKLTIREAGVTARKMATDDFKTGHFALLYSSKDFWSDSAKEYLKTNYGVERYFNPVKETDPMLNAMEVCNEIMANLL